MVAMLRVPSCLALLALGVLGCGREPDAGKGGARQEPSSATAATPAIRFPVWIADLPIAVPLSPHRGGVAYERTRVQMLEQVARNLQGNVSRDAWLLAKEFFARLDRDTAVPLLVEAAARASLRPELAEWLQNVVEAMGTLGDPRCNDTLLAALGHPRESVRDAAMRALVSCGDEAAVLAAYGKLPTLGGRGHFDWIRAACARLREQRVAVFQRVLADPAWQPFYDKIVAELAVVPPAEVVAIVEPLFGRIRGPLRFQIAGLLHAKGDPRGTMVLREALKQPEAKGRLATLEALRGGAIGAFLSDVLALSVDEDPQVREAVVRLIHGIEGEQVTRVLATLALDPSAAVRRAALWSQSRRGERGQIEDLVAELRTASGTRLRATLEDLAAAGDPTALPAIAERMRQAPREEMREYLQAIAYSRAPEALPILRDLFLGPEQVVGRDPGRTTVTYLPTLMANLTGSEAALLELFRALPRDDHRRRAVMLHETLLAMTLNASPQARAALFAHFRLLVRDRAEIPQIRMLALFCLRRDLRIEDALEVRKLAAAEEPAMRHAFEDFLHEFF